MLEKLLFILWLLTWTLGGLLLASAAFHLPRRLTFGVGLTLGAVTQVWFANLFGFFLPAPAAFWTGALLTLALGLIFSWPLNFDKLRQLIPTSWGQILALLFLTYLFTAIGRGLLLFEDYQNLPTISLMARGDIPPTFALDPNVRFGYHYLMLLFAAQVTLLSGIVPWNALDLTRGFFFAPTLLLTYLWVGRMTRSRLAAYAGALFAAFAGGARWLLLLLPITWVASLSQSITLLGSAAQSVPDLARGLLLPWAINGGAPLPFPFAFVNGITPPLILSHGGSGMMVSALTVLILIVYRFVRDWRGGLVMVVLLAALANLSEHAYLAAFFGLGLALLFHWIRTRSIKIPRDFLPWIGLGAASGFFAAFQGGVLTEIVRGLLGPRAGAVSQASYFTVGFSLNPRPTVISGHLGLLDLTNPRQLVVALFEIGPILLALPIVAVWGWKMLKAHRWWDAALVFGGVMGIASLFLQYEGSAGVTATSRLFGDLLTPLTLFAVPLLWTWAKSRSVRVKQTLLLLGFVTIFGGLILFGIEMTAAQKPVLPLAMQPMDIQIYNEYWDKLEPDALVFDTLPARAVTIFGRFTDSNETWYVPKQSWIALAQNPFLRDLRAAGYDYFYYSLINWESFSPEVQSALEDSCVKLVVQADGIRSDTLRPSWVRLVDIRGCE
ncbi:MAG: hypothetical protein C4583_00435 [Anaerolineaceae bacterium]|nr:MAG: hypothetical protein C4583_00435 [Anaerolineaceae bacterium]